MHDGRGPNAVWLLGVVLAGSGILAGCSGQDCLRLPCAAPQPAVSLKVIDAADGGPVADPMANGLPCLRWAGDLCVPLRPDGGTIGTGTSSIDVTASGYSHVEVVVTVPASTREPCSCQPDYVPQTRDVPLTHL